MGTRAAVASLRMATVQYDARLARRMSGVGRHAVVPIAGVLVATAIGYLVARLSFTEANHHLLGVDTYWVLLCASLSVLAVGAYVVWPSRWNIPAHIQLGFAVSAYVIPIWVVRVLDDVPADLVRKYALIVTLGAAAFLGGLLAARAGAQHWRLPARVSATVHSADFAERITLPAALAMSLAIIGVVLSFWVFGFVPFLADDPLAAKFFRGPYQGSYAPVAVLFRSSVAVIATLMPVILAMWYTTRRGYLLALGGLGFVALLGALNRYPAFVGVVLFVGLLGARMRSLGLGFIAAVVILFPLAGSTFFYLLGSLGGLENFKGIYSVTQTFEVVAEGTRDVFDQFLFLGNYEVFGEPTLGRTFYGGLVPWHYEWNPSVYTLSIIAPGQDVNNIVSGGLRLPVPMWGYTAFGWLGVVAVSAISGFVLGAVTLIARREIEGRALVPASLMLVFYMAVGQQLAMFYLLTLYSLPGIAALAFIVFAGGWSGRSRPVWTSSGHRSDELRV